MWALMILWNLSMREIQDRLTKLKCLVTGSDSLYVIDLKLVILFRMEHCIRPSVGELNVPRLWGDRFYKS